MTRKVQLFVLLVLAIFLSGCVTTPNFAINTIEGSASAVHPHQMEKEAVFITRFPVVFPPKLLVETVGTGFIGTWPVIAVDARDPNLGIKSGFAYFKQDYSKTPWRLPLLEAVFYGKIGDLKNYYFLMSNRDGMVWVFSPTGKSFSREAGYDSKKLEADQEYRAKVFSGLGLNLQEIYGFWLKQGWDFKGEIESIEIDSKNPAWLAFEKDLLKSLPHQYKMADGKIIASSFDEKGLKEAIQSNPGLTPWQRFLRQFRIPGVPSPEALGFSTISSVLNFGFQELVSDPNIYGNSASATVTRAEMAEQIEFVYYQTIQQKP